MGQQQILLIVLSVILVGIAIAVGITMFRAQARQSNLDAIVSDLNNLGSIAYQYKIRPVSMGGGSGTYAGFDHATEGYFANLPYEMLNNDNVTQDYEVIDVISTNPPDETELVKIAGWNQNYEHGRQVTVAHDGTMTIQVWEPDATTP